MSDLKQEFDGAMAQLIAPGAPYEVVEGDDSLRCYRNAPVTLHEALAAGRAHGDKEFLIYEGERRSYAQLFAEADAIAAGLQAAGINQGDRVAIAMRNYPEWMASFIAIVSIGAVVVPLNSWGQPADIAFTIEDAQARLAFLDQQRYDGVSEHLAERGIAAVIGRPDDSADPKGLPHFVAGHENAAPVVPDIAQDDVALMMYTSGTSGKPKGAVTSNRAICQAIYNMECCAIAAAMTNGETIAAMLERGFEPTSLLAVPLFHVSGCHAQFLANLRGGRRIVMMYKWDVDKALAYVEQERITTIAAAPAMVLDLLESPDFESTDTSSLFSLGIGGAATPPLVGKLLAEKMPENFSGTGWGMTETNAQGSSLTGKAFRLKPGSSGFPHPIVDFRICDEAGEPLPEGETGEIWVRSVTNIQQYWARPEANATDFRDGWFKTGDVGYIDAEGFLFLADRAKDMIIRGGENIYPVEIENVLIDHDAVKEVAAIGVPHERLGEEVAVVVHLSGELSEDDIVAHCRKHLAAFKVPSHVLIRPEPLPRNATNKILKPVIRDEVLGQLELGD